MIDVHGCSLIFSGGRLILAENCGIHDGNNFEEHLMRWQPLVHAADPHHVFFGQATDVYMSLHSKLKRKKKVQSVPRANELQHSSEDFAASW